MKSLIAVFALGQAVVAFAQLRPGVVPEPDLGALYERASASQYVVTGSVVKSEAIGRRTSDAELLNGTFDPEYHRKGGALLTISVDKTVCRLSDFRAAREKTASVDELYVFLPDTEMWQDILQVGSRYLLFLKVRNQQDWLTTAYQLDPAHEYLQTVSVDDSYMHHGGAFELSGNARSTSVSPDVIRNRGFAQTVLAKVGSLCEAVSTPQIEMRLTRLQALKYSGDAALSEAASKAMDALALSPR